MITLHEKLTAARLLGQARFELVDHPDDSYYMSMREEWDGEEWAWITDLIERSTVFEPFPKRVTSRDAGVRLLPVLVMNGHRYWLEPSWSDGTPTMIRRTTYFYEASYDRIAAEYDEEYVQDSDRMEEAELMKIVSPHVDQENTSLLDVGCGTGLMLDYLKVRPDNYVGIDISTGMTRELAARHPLHRGSLVHCTFEDYFPTRRFDLVLWPFGNAGEMSPDDIKKLSGILNPDGLWIVMAHLLEDTPRSAMRWGIQMRDGALGGLTGAASSTHRIAAYQVFVGS